MSLSPALFTSSHADGPDATLLQPSSWNNVTSLLEELFDGASGSRSASFASLALGTPLAPGSGGTGLASFAVGDLFYASSTSALSRLAAAAGVLMCAGAGQVPSWTTTPSLSSLTVTAANSVTAIHVAATTTTTQLRDLYMGVHAQGAYISLTEDVDNNPEAYIFFYKRTSGLVDTTLSMFANDGMHFGLGIRAGDPAGYHEVMTLSHDVSTNQAAVTLREGRDLTAAALTSSPYNIVKIAPTYNFSSGTRTVRGAYYAPTLTAIVGLTHVAWENTTGDMLFGTTSGRVGVGISPTAVWHVKAGAAAANSAPVKLTAGTNLTTPETGALEYNGTNLFFTRSGTTREGLLSASAVTTEALVSDTSVTVNINGTTYKLLARA